MRWLGLVLGLAISGGAYAQTAPSPANVGVVKGPPIDTFKLLDSSNTWVPFGTANPTTHVFTPVGGGSGGAINVPPAGTTPINGTCPSGQFLYNNAGNVACVAVSGGGASGPITLYPTHALLTAGVPTPTGPATVVQQGFYASGDGGAATYDWNATGLCATNLGTPTPDGIICILPSGQSNLTPGRYMLRMPNGMLDARVMGFSDDGRDNSPINDALISVIHANPRPPIVFSANPNIQTSNFWFSKPFDVIQEGPIICGDGSRAYSSVINLIFMPGVSGVKFANVFYTGPGYPVYPTSSLVWQSRIKGCGIFSMGQSISTTNLTPGSAVVPMNPFTISDFVSEGGSVPATMPQWAVGDSMVMLSGNYLWNFNGYITPGRAGFNVSTLTVTSAPTGGDGNPAGLQVGQQIQDSGVPHGLYIASDATHFPTWCNPNCTGTGGVGTYSLDGDIVNPPNPGEGVAGGLIGSSGSPVAFETEPPSGPVMFPPGTTITGCSTLSGTQCPYAGGATLTLSNPANRVNGYVSYALPGPNNALGSQMYNVTTSLAGHTYGPITAGVSGGSTMTVTAGGANLNLGQVAMGISGGSITGRTTTGALTLGQTTGIPISSCTGVVAGMNVVAFHSGNPVFPPGTTVAGCSGTALSINILAGDSYGGDTGMSGVFGDAELGSRVVKFDQTYTPIGQFWIGMPAKGTGSFASLVPAGTTVTGFVSDPGVPHSVNVTLSNAVTVGATFDLTMDFGGVIDAAPSGTALTFLNGFANIIAGPVGGGNGVYTLDQSVPTLAPGSTVYAYDTPGTVFVTGGPRLLTPQELLWSDAIPWGAISAKLYGSSPSQQTIVTSASNSYGAISAQVAHAAGSGKMWALPSGIYAPNESDIESNIVAGFAPGLNMPCAADNYRPSSGCGQSYAKRNIFFYNIMGRFVAGNNSGGSAAEFDEYDHNLIADIADIGTVGTAYIGEMLQGQDESSNTTVMRVDCNALSSMYGSYASGAVSSVCAQAMIFDSTTSRGGPAWAAAIYGAPWNVNYSVYSTGVLLNCPPGAPSSSFEVKGGLVTHC